MPAFVNVPANPAIPVILEVVTKMFLLEADTTSQEIVSVWHFAGQSGNPGGLNLAQFAFNFTGWWGTNAQSTEYANGVANARVLDDPTSLPCVDQPLSDGVITGDRLPSFNAAVIDLVTDARGRCFRGRKHLGPVAESGSTMDELAGTTLTAYTALEAALLGGVTLSDGGANSFDLCVLSRINSNLIGPGVYFTYAIVTKGVLSVKLGTMRRRKEGVGS